MAQKKYFDVIGLMSGSSCDGLDLALCRLYRYRKAWHYRILKADTFAYTEEWISMLRTAAKMNAEDLLKLHSAYGRYLGGAVKEFLGGCPADKAALIASHGHTVFHNPESRLTFQLGEGAVIAALTGIVTVSDFRRLDVAHGGQGAPLVPVGDELLFSEYDACLNLGGFANISFKKGSTRLAFDICPVNTALNFLAAEKGLDFDEDGKTGRMGKASADLLSRLNGLSFYHLNGPRSLGREWLEDAFLPLIIRSGLALEDKLATVYEHIRQQITKVLHNPGHSPSVLVTGGGAFNIFLIELLKQSGARIIIPDQVLVRYKEALVFALLGLLRYRGEKNCLASVTGADKDLCTGVIHKT